MIRWFYNFGIRFFDLLILLASFKNEKARKMLEGRKNTNRILEEKLDSSKQYVWFHAASLGEFEQGRPLIEGLKKGYPEMGVILTFYSPSGYEVRNNYQGADIVCYLPSDTRRNVNDFLNLVEPVAAIFIKYEFWPNYLIELSKAKVPVYLVSSIFRKDQLFFKSYGVSYLKLLKRFTKIFVQDKQSADLLDSNGICHWEIAGDTRFDRVVEIKKSIQKIDKVEFFTQGKKVVVAGSTWPDDEKLLAGLNLSNEKIIIVPHEIGETHILQVLSIFKSHKPIRLSKAKEQDLIEANCLVVDSIGLLSSIYQYASWAYIGGGFGVGIHNTLEASVFGIAVVFGPNYTQFREACELIDCGGGFTVKNIVELQKTKEFIDANPQTGEKAGKYTMQNTGATEKILTELYRFF